MRLASYVPGELIPLPLSGSIPELPHVAKLVLSRIADRDSVRLGRAFAGAMHVGAAGERPRAVLLCV
jgi:hypothetical protein